MFFVYVACMFVGMLAMLGVAYRAFFNDPKIELELPIWTPPEHLTLKGTNENNEHQSSTKEDQASIL